MTISNTHMSSKTISRTIKNMVMAAFERDGVTREAACVKPPICAGLPPGRRRRAFRHRLSVHRLNFRAQRLVFQFYPPTIPYEIGLLYPALRSRLHLARELADAAKAYIRTLLYEQSLRRPQSATSPLRIFSKWVWQICIRCYMHLIGHDPMKDYALCRLGTRNPPATSKRRTRC